VPVLSVRDVGASSQLAGLAEAPFCPLALNRDGSAFIHEGNGSIRGRGGRLRRTLRPDGPLLLVSEGGKVGGAGAAVTLADPAAVASDVGGTGDVALLLKPGS
jgi:hypothetical protein